ncbi:hypothetical protein [Streptomyces erythrochromogenes]|uniref:hypothetical protein n=1 Tax=Streptomyces erythrochromogenes TaxID=285574 RepID=UPI000A488CB0|nr:hypothetical protein [Streptomyces erythrochromogenes]
MAEDNGGILAVGLSGDVAASIRAQAEAQARAAALRIEYDDLKQYQKLVDGLLTSLQESPAHHGKLADGALPTGALGTGFPEADKLYEAYKTVHSELQKLSKGLAGQIEALGIAVQSASGGYAEVDEETKRRMGLLAKQAHDEYVLDRDPYAEKKGTGPQPTGKGGVLG